MTKVTVYLCPVEMFLLAFKPEDQLLELIRQALPRYSKVPNSFNSPYAGQAAAEDAFSLTNIEARQDECEAKYGNGRAISVCDVVEVDGVKLACLTFGWQKL